MNIVTNNKWIGQSTIRPDGMDKVTGRAQFAADTNMPGMIWGKVLRSPHPHARIRGIDTSKAEKLPGVKAVVTARDIVDFTIEKGAVMLGIQDMRWMCRNVMAREKALFPGHPIAAVAATTEAIAAEACKLIEVDYEVLPWSIEIDDAIKPDAAILHELYRLRDQIRAARPDVLLVMSADHVYRFDFQDAIATHLNAGAACTIVTTERPLDEAGDHACVEVGIGGVVTLKVR